MHHDLLWDKNMINLFAKLSLLRQKDKKVQRQKDKATRRYKDKKTIIVLNRTWGVQEASPILALTTMKGTHSSNTGICHHPNYHPNIFLIFTFVFFSFLIYPGGRMWRSKALHCVALIKKCFLLTFSEDLHHSLPEGRHLLGCLNINQFNDKATNLRSRQPI